jgi:hypothetical protein
VRAVSVQTTDCQLASEGNNYFMVALIPAAGVIEKRAEDAEIRAEIARTRAAEALAHADWDESHGFPRAAAMHRREAALHERSAHRQDQAAALQRVHRVLVSTAPGHAPARFAGD